MTPRQIKEELYTDDYLKNIHLFISSSYIIYEDECFYRGESTRNTSKHKQAHTHGHMYTHAWTYAHTLPGKVIAKEKKEEKYILIYYSTVRVLLANNCTKFSNFLIIAAVGRSTIKENLKIECNYSLRA